jgi:hypothetical protein
VNTIVAGTYPASTDPDVAVCIRANPVGETGALSRDLHGDELPAFAQLCPFHVEDLDDASSVGIVSDAGIANVQPLVIRGETEPVGLV